MLPSSFRAACSRVLTIGERLLGAVVAVPACLACDASVRADVAFCASCAASIEPPPQGSVVAVGRYGGALGEAIQRLKYGNAAWVAGPLGDLLAARCLDEGCAPDLVVPVPLHVKRLYERGYNQSALLASRLGRAGFGVDPCALERVRETDAQAALGRNDRLVNLESAFRARRDLRGMTVLLVDDVATTGATLAACRAAVHAAGGLVTGAAVVGLVGEDD